MTASLRRLADRIDHGEYGEVRFLGAVIVGGVNGIATFGWGHGSDLEFAGAFARASVTSGCCVEEMRETVTEGDDA